MTPSEKADLAARLISEYDRGGDGAEAAEFRANMAAACAADPHALAGVLIAAQDAAEHSGRLLVAVALAGAAHELIHEEWDPAAGMRACPEEERRR